MKLLHENPQTPYEIMLDANDLDCSLYGCWKPIRFIVLIGGDPLGVCDEHSHGADVVQVLES